MHYKNGREAHNGDPVIAETYKGSGNFIAGTLHSLMPGTTSCNAQIAYPLPGSCGNTCVTVGDVYHAEDAFKALERQATVAAAAALPDQPVVS